MRGDDFDAAIARGLLDAATGCGHCSAACIAALQAARAQRQRALAARERYRAREARLVRQQHERAGRRKSVAAATGGDAAPAYAPSLPPAAAAALARAKAKAAGTRSR